MVAYAIERLLWGTAKIVFTGRGKPKPYVEDKND
jgi:hypothetical protein